MKKYHIEITQRAENDIIDIAKYISQELFDRNAADKLVDEIYRVILSLGNMPKRHNEIVDDEQIIPKGIRRVVVKNYDIYYSFNEDKKIVYIRRVLYGKREWQNLV